MSRPVQRVQLPDGRGISAVVAGSGGPTVVFEAGLSGAASSWLPVQRLVAEHTTTVSYDRSGLGASDVDGQPRTLERLAADLSQLLDALGQDGPLVLVGHSWGGPVLRTFAAAHPERVAALVLVDATTSRLIGPGAVRQAVASYRLVSSLARIGLHRPLVKLMLGGATAHLDPADREVMEADATDPRSWSTGLQEARAIAASTPGLQRLEKDGLPDVDVVAICGGRAGRLDTKVRAAMVDAWRMQTSTRGRFVLAEHSGHLVPQQQPDLVADEILRVVKDGR